MTCRNSLGLVEVTPDLFVSIEVVTSSLRVLRPDQVIELGQALVDLGRALAEIHDDYAPTV